MAAYLPLDGELYHPAVFAITGFTLNHQSWFTGVNPPKRFTGTLEPSWLKAPADHKDQIVAAFRSRHGIRAGLTDFSRR